MAHLLTIGNLKGLFEPVGGAFVAFLFWIIFQCVFKLDFKCPCDPDENTRVCMIYMALPAISLFIVLMITEKRIRTIFCSKETRTASFSVFIFLMSAIKGLSVACLWMITVLMDEDWYVCLTTTNYDLPPCEQTFCKSVKTSAETATIRVKRCFSREMAMYVLFGVSIIWACTTIRQCHYEKPLAYQYNKFLLDEANLYITEELQKLAKDNAVKRGKKQIQDLKAFLHLDVSETGKQQPPSNA
ncbi:uncharacterized protein LOC122353114 [Puntigrus tetrazona]|uniref:uncharacterized protein LOC122353114 n=1 Tax=Puntigrus tetrazona TaxID=1606681 RepID=UPI001C8AFAEB|nr:uncharacterized protein LOC122353114 [Puntigrus tetrazona]